MTALTLFQDIERSAVISECGTYRYQLKRAWGPGPLLPWVMLNPSTADAEKDDATMLAVMRFSRREGYDGCVVVNLWAYRTKDPKEMFAAYRRGLDISGPENHVYIGLHVTPASGAVAAWGANAYATRKGERDCFRAVVSGHVRWAQRCLGTTANGAPRHPLYLPTETPLMTFDINAVKA